MSLYFIMDKVINNQTAKESTQKAESLVSVWSVCVPHTRYENAEVTGPRGVPVPIQCRGRTRLVEWMAVTSHCWQCVALWCRGVPGTAFQVLFWQQAHSFTAVALTPSSQHTSVESFTPATLWERGWSLAHGWDRELQTQWQLHCLELPQRLLQPPAN